MTRSKCRIAQKCYLFILLKANTFAGRMNEEKGHTMQQYKFDQIWYTQYDVKMMKIAATLKTL